MTSTPAPAAPSPAAPTPAAQAHQPAPVPAQPQPQAPRPAAASGSPSKYMGFGNDRSGSGPDHKPLSSYFTNTPPPPAAQSAGSSSSPAGSSIVCFPSSGGFGVCYVVRHKSCILQCIIYPLNRRSTIPVPLVSMPHTHFWRDCRLAVCGRSILPWCQWCQRWQRSQPLTAVALGGDRAHGRQQVTAAHVRERCLTGGRVQGHFWAHATSCNKPWHVGTCRVSERARL